MITHTLGFEIVGTFKAHDNGIDKLQGFIGTRLQGKRLIEVFAWHANGAQLRAIYRRSKAKKAEHGLALVRQVEYEGASEGALAKLGRDILAANKRIVDSGDVYIGALHQFAHDVDETLLLTWTEEWHASGGG